MRWKWLLILSLIAISVVTVSGDDEYSEKVDKVSENNYNDEDYEEPKDEVKVEEETQTPTDAEIAGDPNVDTAVVSDDEPLANDSGTVEIGKQSGKYMNYDDDFQYYNAQMDGTDGYNWNGESPNLLVRLASYQHDKR